MRSNYGNWLQANFQAATRATQLTQARRLEQAYGDLDQHFERDKFHSILADLTYSTDDAAEGKSNPSRITIEGNNLYEGLAHLRSAVNYYIRFLVADGDETTSTPSWPELDTMRATFLQRCSDFADFEQDFGTYFNTERAYKDALIRDVQAILSGPDSGHAEQVGRQLLTLLDSRKSNLVGWRAFVEISNGGADAQQRVAAALGKMVLSTDDAPVAVAAAAELIHPIISQGAMGNPAFGQVRSLVTSALALARPSEAISVKTRFMQRASKALTGRSIFKSAVVSPEEYQAFLDLAARVRKAMVGWGWKPRDLWDVQGFLWVVTDNEWAAQVGPTDATGGEEKDNKSMINTRRHPLNCILFGPLGTGKTWTTARLAVEICSGSAPSDRGGVMRAYNELLQSTPATAYPLHQIQLLAIISCGNSAATEYSGDSIPIAPNSAPRHHLLRQLYFLTLPRNLRPRPLLQPRRLRRQGRRLGFARFEGFQLSFGVNSATPYLFNRDGV